MPNISATESPFRAFSAEVLYALSPRASPWAFTFRAFGAVGSSFDTDSTASGTDSMPSAAESLRQTVSYLNGVLSEEPLIPMDFGDDKGKNAGKSARNPWISWVLRAVLFNAF